MFSIIEVTIGQQLSKEFVYKFQVVVNIKNVVVFILQMRSDKRLLLTQCLLYEVVIIVSFRRFMKKKVSRKYVDWLQIMFDLNRYELNSYCRDLFNRKKSGKHLSLRRCAYYTLKHYYSTTTIGELCEKLGV